MGIDPHDVRALTSKGLALGGLGNYTKAIDYFDKALGIDPDHIRALDNNGSYLPRKLCWCHKKFYRIF